MLRREFITLLGGAAGTCVAACRRRTTGWPGAVRLGAPPMPLRRTIPRDRPALARSGKNSKQLGWTEGRNIRIDYHWAEGDADPLASPSAAKLVGLMPDVILPATAR